MPNKSILFIIITVIILGIVGLVAYKKCKFSPSVAIGVRIDSLNGVYVYNNRNFSNISGRNITSDNYNLGLKYQCVEFVKRYYYEHFNHRMPDSYGNAKDYFDRKLGDGKRNKRRNLTQHTNPSTVRPKRNDLLVFSGSIFNKFGHVAIVSKVSDTEIELIQQNAGSVNNSRERFRLTHLDGRWKIDNERIIGWLRM